MVALLNRSFGDDPCLLQATVEHRSASGAVAVTLTGKRWEVAHDFGKKASAPALMLQVWAVFPPGCGGCSGQHTAVFLSWWLCLYKDSICPL